MKKILSVIMMTAVICLNFAACKMGAEETSSVESQGFETAKEISVISREAGAGIRSAFANAFALAEEGAEDVIHSAATLKNSTKDVVSAVKNDAYSIAYLPLSQITDDVKVLSVDSVMPNAENIKNGKYKYTHNLNAITLKETSSEAEDFLSFILSKEGQQIITQQGLVSNSDTGEFSSKKPKGDLNVYCTDSAEELLKKLKKAYEEINGELEIDISVYNSKAALEKIKEKTDIAIITRELTGSEQENFKENTFAKDGVAVVVNKNNTRTNVTAQNIKDIFSGKKTIWKDID